MTSQGAGEPFRPGENIMGYQTAMKFLQPEKLEIKKTMLW